MIRVHHSCAATRVVASPTGPFVLHLSADGALTSEWRHLAELGDASVRSKGNSAWLDHVAERLAGYFAGESVPDWSDVPTPDGPEFHHRCWDACRSIPHGEVRSYGELAEMAGSTRLASRAAGQAMRTKPLPVIVPCHRVVGSDGKLHGYAGTTNLESDALGVKRGLLKLERRSMPVLAAR